MELAISGIIIILHNNNIVKFPKLTFKWLIIGITKQMAAVTWKRAARNIDKKYLKYSWVWMYFKLCNTITSAIDCLIILNEFVNKPKATNRNRPIHGDVKFL